MTDLTLYGIASCDACRKARRWLENQNIGFNYHDLRVDGLSDSRLSKWVKRAGWERILNRRSVTWRQLPDVDREIKDDDDAKRLMLANPTLVKRPVLESKTTLMIGFEEKEYARVLGSRDG